MSEGPRWLPVLILFALLGLAYLGMWRGWRRRGRKHDLPPLVETPAVADLPDAHARVRRALLRHHDQRRLARPGRGPRARRPQQLPALAVAEGLDVVRLAGSFRIPAAALRGARHDRGIAGKVVPPHGVLVVTWQHGEHLLDTGFRLTDPDRSGGGARTPHRRTIDEDGTTEGARSKMAKENAA